MTPGIARSTGGGNSSRWAYPDLYPLHTHWRHGPVNEGVSGDVTCRGTRLPKYHPWRSLATNLHCTELAFMPALTSNQRSATSRLDK